jgi:hypothetical protein
MRNRKASRRADVYLVQLAGVRARNAFDAAVGLINGIPNGQIPFPAVAAPLQWSYATTPAGGAAAQVTIPLPPFFRGHSALVVTTWDVTDRAAAAPPNDVIAFGGRIEVMCIVSADGHARVVPTGGGQASEPDSLVGDAALNTSTCTVTHIGIDVTIVFTPPAGYPRALDWTARSELILN